MKFHFDLVNCYSPWRTNCIITIWFLIVGGDTCHCKFHFFFHFSLVTKKSLDTVTIENYFPNDVVEYFVHENKSKVEAT